MRYDVNSWYASLDKIAQLAGLAWLPTQPVSQISVADLERVAVVAAAKDAVLRVLRERGIRSLEEQVIRGTLGEGALFTCHRDYYGKGLQGLQYNDPDITNAPMAEVYTKLKDLPYSMLRVSYHPSNIYSVSGWSALGGHQRLFVAGYVERIDGDVIHARPYIIGQLIGAGEGEDGLSWVLQSYGRVYPESIDEFSRIAEVDNVPSRKQTEILKEFPERRIKEIVGELIGVDDPPRDWGGERSDLLGDVHIDGRRLTAAFVLKGPAQFRRMTLATLGKNGDQIYRAFTEPAELIVLQHCHDVDSSVVATLKAFANQAGEQRLFCVMDGRDTWRLLKAYSYLS